MKKIFILPILIAPIMAHATDPVGPSAVAQGQTAVVATANAPYATATDQTGDSTTVVSASYVKGAYNDAIAAVNKVNSDLSDLSSYVNNDVEDEISGLQEQIDDKQDKLINYSSNNEINYSNVAGATIFSDMVSHHFVDDMGADEVDDFLVSAGGVLAGIDEVFFYKRVSAVTTWGSNTTTKIPLVNQ